MAETFHLTVLTPERPVLDEDVVSIVAPGAQGYLGVLAHHAPLITSLVPGKLSVREGTGEQERTFAISGGFLEVSENTATILADAIETPDAIDIARAEGALKRAQERLADVRANIDRSRAQVALERATNRIRIVKNH
jgi:F-type H+-transporting ATPase subunit epsilon